MATPQNDLDRLAIAWDKLRAAVNSVLPNHTSKLWAIRNRLTPGGGSGPRPS